MRAMTYTMVMTDEWVATLESEVPYYVDIGSLPEALDPAPLVDMEFIDMVNPEWNQLSAG